MNEIATTTPALPAMPQSGAANAELASWAEGLASAHRIATLLCNTAFAPAHFKGKPEEAAAAILYGAEIGFTPTQALANLYIIGGKPAMYARPMVALVQSAGHEVWTEEKTDESVTVCGRRRGSEHITRETWTTQRAQRAGYTNNKKYQTDPQAMLYARAASDVCRQIAADTLAGIGHSVEEMQLAGADRPTPTGPAPAAPTVAAFTGDQAPEPMTDRTRRKMFALFGAKGVGEDKQLAGINFYTGGSYTSRGDLTEADAQTVIARLEELDDAPAADAVTGEVIDEATDPWPTEDGEQA